MSELPVITEYRSLEERILSAMTPTLPEAEFSTLALEIFAFQCRWNSTYQAFTRASSAPDAWQEIPAVPQSAFKHSHLSCVPTDAVRTVFRTSGTTGESRGEHHFLDTRLYDAAIIRGWSWLGVKSLPLRIIARSGADAPDSSLSHMFSEIGRTLPAVDATWFVSQEGAIEVDAFVRSIDPGEPIGLLGTALGFLNLFEQLGHQRITLPRGSFVLETGGYKGSGRELTKRDLYSMFEDYLGVPAEEIINEYGMTELSSQFYTRGLGRPHTSPPWLKARVVDPETGREVAVGGLGILRIFDLANLNSALAIETQDLAIRHEAGFELIGRDPAALPRGCSRAADELLRR
ncbi:MAG TPA: hypothetical protein VFG14_01060 [Chthoniobacteraceae bacterium]|nr:hypothetical protein [Chthoniobacteraceae bacterium]